MTTTQVRYWELQEAGRHNLASERLTASQLKETQRHNIVSERQGWTGLKIDALKAKETHRHNVATENLTATDIAEKKRHNQSEEYLSASQIAESIRHNRAQEYETHRSNVTRERETQRSNMAREEISYAQINTKVREIQVAMEKLGIDRDRNAIEKAYKTATIDLENKKFTRDLAFGITDRILDLLGISAKSASSLASAIIPILLG